MLQYLPLFTIICGILQLFIIKTIITIIYNYYYYLKLLN